MAIAAVALLLALRSAVLYAMASAYAGVLVIIALGAILVTGVRSLRRARDLFAHEHGLLLAGTSELLAARRRRLETIAKAGGQPNLSVLRDATEADLASEGMLGRYFVAVAILVGLVGTFLGMQGAFATVAPLLTDETTAFAHLAEPLSSLEVAFGASIVAILTTLSLSLLQSDVHLAESRLIATLDDHTAHGLIAELWPVKEASDSLVARTVLDALKEISQHLARIDDSQHRSAVALAAAAAENSIALQAGSAASAAAIERASERTTQTLETLITKTALSLDGLGDRALAIVKDVGDRTLTALRETSDKTNTTLTALGAQTSQSIVDLGDRALAIVKETSDKTTVTLTSIGTKTATALDGLADKTTVTLTTIGTKTATALDGLADKAAAIVGDSSQKNLAALEAAGARATKSIDDAATRTIEALAGVGQETANALKELGAETASAIATSVQTAANESISALNHAATESLTAFNTAAADAAEHGADMVTAFNEAATAAATRGEERATLVQEQLGLALEQHVGRLSTQHAEAAEALRIATTDLAASATALKPATEAIGAELLPEIRRLIEQVALIAADGKDDEISAATFSELARVAGSVDALHTLMTGRRSSGGEAANDA